MLLLLVAIHADTMTEIARPQSAPPFFPCCFASEYIYVFGACHFVHSSEAMDTTGAAISLFISFFFHEDRFFLLFLPSFYFASDFLLACLFSIFVLFLSSVFTTFAPSSRFLQFFFFQRAFPIFRHEYLYLVTAAGFLGNQPIYDNDNYLSTN